MEHAYDRRNELTLRDIAVHTLEGQKVFCLRCHAYVNPFVFDKVGKAQPVECKAPLRFEER